MVRILKNRSGQTSIEYLLLLATTFLFTFLVMKGPIAATTRGFLVAIRSSIQNFVRTAEYGTDEISVGNANHPGQPERFRPAHF